MTLFSYYLESVSRSVVSFSATPWTAVCQSSPSMGFSRQEHWSGLPFPSTMHESEKCKVKSFSRIWLLATPWTAAYQTPLSMGFSRQDYWSGVPSPSTEDPLVLWESPAPRGWLSQASSTVWGSSSPLFPSSFPFTESELQSELEALLPALLLFSPLFFS